MCIYNIIFIYHILKIILNTILNNIKLSKNERSKFELRLINELIYNKIKINNFMNNKIKKYIDNDKYIILERNKINNDIIDKLYIESKYKFIKYPNLFTINIDNIYI